MDEIEVTYQEISPMVHLPAVRRSKEDHRLFDWTESRFAAMLDAIEDGVVLVSPEGRVLYLNRASVRSLEPATGLSSREEFVGLDACDLYLPHDFDFPDMAELATRLAAGPITSERLHQTRRGLRWHEAKVSPIYCDDGGLAAIALISRDIHDRKQAQEELARALTLSEHIMAAMGHDLLNPLSAVQGLTALLLADPAKSALQQRHLQQIDGAARRMAELVGTLLDIVRSGFRAPPPLQRATTHLHELARELVDEASATHPGRSIQLEVRDERPGHWDRARLGEVIANLVGNALKHGSADAPISVIVEGDALEATLRVNNRGPVIAPEFLPAIFEPFRRGPDSSVRSANSNDKARADGLGMGLFIVRQLVLAHGGTIAAESSESLGTTFTVKLPRATG